MVTCSLRFSRRRQAGMKRPHNRPTSTHRTCNLKVAKPPILATTDRPTATATACDTASYKPPHSLPTHVVATANALKRDGRGRARDFSSVDDVYTVTFLDVMRHCTTLASHLLTSSPFVCHIT